MTSAPASPPRTTPTRSRSAPPPTRAIVYVDNDPIVLAHARALLTSDPGGATDYIDADLRNTGAILAQAARTLDFARPVAVMLVGILQCIPDEDDPRAIVAALMDGFPPGSYLAISHPAADVHAQARAGAALLNEGLASPRHLPHPRRHRAVLRWPGAGRAGTGLHLSVAFRRGHRHQAPGQLGRRGPQDLTPGAPPLSRGSRPARAEAGGRRQLVAAQERATAGPAPGPPAPRPATAPAGPFLTCERPGRDNLRCQPHPVTRLRSPHECHRAVSGQQCPLRGDVLRPAAHAAIGPRRRGRLHGRPAQRVRHPRPGRR